MWSYNDSSFPNWATPFVPMHNALFVIAPPIFIFFQIWNSQQPWNNRPDVHWLEQYLRIPIVQMLQATMPFRVLSAALQTGQLLVKLSYRVEITISNCYILSTRCLYSKIIKISWLNVCQESFIIVIDNFKIGKKSKLSEHWWHRHFRQCSNVAYTIHFLLQQHRMSCIWTWNGRHIQ